MGGPLVDLRVVDATDDSGRFATKLLAEAGARVVRVDTGTAVSRGPAMVDSDAAEAGGLLDWWYDGGKTTVRIDLDSADGAAAYRRLALGADLVVETLPPGRLAALGLDHDALVADHPQLVQVSLTPFGRQGPWAGWRSSDLVASALGGVLSVSGLPDQAVNPWGRQSFHFGSYYAALSGLAAVRHARRTGTGQLVDLSLHESVAASIEQLWFQYHYDDIMPVPLPKRALRQGSLHWLRAYAVTACRTGHVMICPTPDAPALLTWMVEEGVEGAAELVAALTADPASLVARIDDVMEVTRRFARTKDAGPLFHEAQARHVAFGEVQSVAQAVTNPQFAHRSLIVPTTPTPAGASIRRPRLPIDFGATPNDPPAPPAASSVDAVLAEWPALRPAAAGPTADGSDPAGRPLAGLRVLDLTWVLAGPFCCRMLGDLGADIVKVQTAERSTLVNSPDFPYFPCWNRSKRSLALDMKAEGSAAIVRRLVEQSDVLIENYSAGVLDRWGLDWATVHALNPRLVYVSMSGCGHTGPWKDMISYAPTVHALCGLTHLSNPPDRGDVGVGFSLNDHAAGFTGAFAVLAALEARERTGEGQHVDIAQVEVGAYLIGSALTELLANGREVQPDGNVDPFASFVVNDVFAASDGEVAVTVRDGADEAVVVALIGGPVEGLAAWCASRTARAVMEALQAVGVAAGRVQDGDLLFTDDEQLAARNAFGTLASDVFGDRPFERFPARFSRSVLDPYRPAPNYLGEHAFEILAELVGMSDEDVAVAMGEGVLT